jgi:CrcB protein
MAWFAVALGGALGTAARHFVNLMITHRFQQTAYATAVVNLVGSALIGVLAGAVATEWLRITPAMRAFVFVGVLGGFTTFSSFMLDTFTMASIGHHPAAILNVIVQNTAGFALLWIGYYAVSLAR